MPGVARGGGVAGDVPVGIDQGQVNQVFGSSRVRIVVLSAVPGPAPTRPGGETEPPGEYDAGVRSSDFDGARAEVRHAVDVTGLRASFLAKSDCEVSLGLG